MLALCKMGNLGYFTPISGVKGALLIYLVAAHLVSTKQTLNSQKATKKGGIM